MASGVFQNIVAGMASAIELWPERTRLILVEGARQRPRPSMAEAFHKDKENVANDMRRAMGTLDAENPARG